MPDQTIESSPNLLGFNPYVIPYQGAVVDYMHGFDYSKGTPEILLSGSYGCLREDALIETACGKVPICDIKRGDYLLSFCHSKDRFVYQSCNGAYPKGRANLYLVKHEHGEFVATDNHRIATYQGDYLQVKNLTSEVDLLSPSSSQSGLYREADLLLSFANVLHCWDTVSSLIYHYSECIRRCDPTLLGALNIVLNAFPLQDDALKSGQFSYKNKLGQRGDFRGLEQELGHISELRDQTCMLRLLYLSGHPALALAGEDFYSKFSGHTFEDTLQSLLFREPVDHPKVLLSFLYHICIALHHSLSINNLPSCVTKSSILGIEELGVGWFWDIKVPNTNNYVAEGLIHHNSAKSILMAHLAVVHCLENPGARACLARKAMPDLKRTIYKEIIEHIEQDLTEGVDYWASENRGYIKFANGSEVISISWADKKYKKGRSLKLSFLAFEELTENNDADFEAFKTLKARLRRIVGIKQNVLIAATNPDEPSHWVYDYFIEPNEGGRNHKTREVFYSVTTDNPFLDPIYIEQLEADLTAREVLRFIYGKWISLKSATIYYEYDKEHNHINTKYTIDKNYPVICAWDFNIGEGKPMSMSFMQYIGDHFHIFDEIIMHGSRTLNTLEEALSRGLLTKDMIYYICGDASGKARDTRSNRSDWQIIKDFFEDEGLQYEYKVPRANPPIKTRHNRVNAYFKNSKGQRRTTIYQKAKMTEKGFRLTKLKAGGQYIEDDSKEEQHVTTAIGYAIVRLGKKPRKKDNTGTIIL